MGLLDDAIREHLDLKRQRGADPGEVERLEREALGPVRREPAGRGMGPVPHLDVNADPERDFEPATELLQTDPVQEPKRGFLRRHRAAPTPQPGPEDFAGHLDAGYGQPGQSHDDPFEDADPFGQEAFDHDDPFPDDAPLAEADPATHEHAAAAPPAELPPAAPPAEPVVEGPPAHLIFGSAPPPRPSFAPVPARTPAPEAEPAPADAAEPEPAAEETATAGPTSDPAPAADPAPPEPAPDNHARADAAGETREWSVDEAFAAQDGGDTAPAADPAEEDVLEETPEFLQDTPDHDRLWFEQRPPRDFDFDG